MAATQAPGSPASRAVTSAARGEIPRPDAQRSTPARDRTRRQGRHGFRGNAERKVVVACDGGGIDEVVAEIGEVGAPAAPRHEPWSPPFAGTDSASEALAASGTMVAGAVEELATVVEKLIELASRGWTQLPGPEAKRVVQILERGSRASAAIQSGALVAVEASEQWVKDGNRNVNEWVASETGRSKAAAAKAARAAKELDENLPETRKALARGEISEDHVNAIATRCTKTRKHRDALKDPRRGEAYLLEQARQMNASQFAKVAHGWAVAKDPAAADRAWREDAKKEEVNLTPTAEGFVLGGWLGSVSGQILQTALASHMGRKAADDERPYPVRRAEALVGLAQQSLDRGSQMPNARIRPHLTVTMDYSTLDGLVRAAGSSVPAGQAAGFAAMTPARRAEAEEIWAKNWLPGDDHTISTTLSYEALEDIPAATLPDGSALAPAMLAKLACGSMINRVVFGPLSTILDAGREERIFPANQTRAIIARDRHCQFPGCDEGPDFGEIHHSLEWFKHNGTTHADLGILLCYGHHAYVHRENITIARTSGRWEFIDRRGRPIRAPKLGQQGNADPPPLSEREAVAGPGSGRNGWPPPTAGPPGRDPAPGLPPGNAPRGSGPPVTIDAPTAMCVEEPLFSDPPGGTRANRDPAPPF